MNRRIAGAAAALALIAAAVVAVRLIARDRQEADSSLEGASTQSSGQAGCVSAAGKGGASARTGEGSPSASVPPAGAANPGEPGPAGPAVRIRGRVIDRDSRAPVTRFLVGFIPRSPGSPIRIPVFDLFGSWGEIKAAFTKAFAAPNRWGLETVYYPAGGG